MRVLLESKYNLNDEVYIKDVNDIYAGWRSMFKQLGFKDKIINDTDLREQEYYYSMRWQIFAKVYKDNQFIYGIRSLDDYQFELLVDERNIYIPTLLQTTINKITKELNG